MSQFFLCSAYSIEKCISYFQVFAVLLTFLVTNLKLQSGVAFAANGKWFQKVKKILVTKITVATLLEKRPITTIFLEVFKSNIGSGLTRFVSIFNSSK